MIEHLFLIAFLVVVYLAIPTLCAQFVLFRASSRFLNRSENLFVNHLLWLFLSVLIWANVQTRGNTILNGAFVIVLAAVLWSKWKNENSVGLKTVKPSLKILWLQIAFVICLIIFFLGSRIAFYWDSLYGLVDFEIVDYFIYSKSASWISSAGAENLNYNNSNGARFPYHYFDLWLYSIFGTLGKFNSSVILGSSSVVLLVVTTLGMNALSSLKDVGYRVPIIVLPFVFLYAGFYLNSWATHDEFHFVNAYAISLYGYPRHCVILLVFIVAYWCRNNPFNVFCSLLLIPFLSVVPTIGVAVFLVGYIFVIWFQKGFKYIAPMIAIGILAAVIFIGFHLDWLYSVLNESGMEHGSKEMGVRDVFYRIRQLIYRNVIAHFFLLICAVLFLLLKKKIHGQVTVITIFTLGVCATLSLIGSDFNSFQIYTNVLLPLISLVIFLTLSSIYETYLWSRWKRRIISSCIIFILLLFQIPEFGKTQRAIQNAKADFDKEFVEKVFERIDESPELQFIGAVATYEYLERLSKMKISEGAYPVGISIVSFRRNSVFHAHTINLADLAQTEIEKTYLQFNSDYNPFTRAALTGENLIPVPDLLIVNSLEKERYMELLQSYTEEFSTKNGKYLFYSKNTF